MYSVYCVVFSKDAPPSPSSEQIPSGKALPFSGRPTSVSQPFLTMRSPWCPSKVQCSGAYWIPSKSAPSLEGPGDLHFNLALIIIFCLSYTPVPESSESHSPPSSFDFLSSLVHSCITVTFLLKVYSLVYELVPEGGQRAYLLSSFLQGGIWPDRQLALYSSGVSIATR